MYKCNDCGRIFEEPLEIRELMGEYWGAPAYDIFYYCPYCKSDDYDEVTLCDDED